MIAVEPEAAPSLTRGVYAYDFGDTGKLTPLVKMHTLGSDFVPEPIHAGGLRYHGMAPLVSLLKEHGDIEARSVHQRSSFEAGVAFARAEGILPAPSRATPSAPRSTRQTRPRRPARHGSSCSTCVAMVTSTCRRISATWTARSRTTSTRPTRWRPRWQNLGHAIRRDRHIDKFDVLHTSTYAEDDYSSGISLKALELLDQAALDTCRQKGDRLLTGLRI